MRAIKQLAAVARMPAQLAAVSDHIARHLVAVTTALERLNASIWQLRQDARTVTVLLLGEGLDDDERTRPIFAVVNALVPSGEGSHAQGYLQLQRPVAKGAWLLAVGGLLSDVQIGKYSAYASSSCPSPLVRLPEPIMIAVQVQFKVHRLP